MADEVLDPLRVNFARLNERIDRIEADMAEFRERLGHIEGQIVGIYGCTPLCPIQLAEIASLRSQ